MTITDEQWDAIERMIEMEKNKDAEKMLNDVADDPRLLWRLAGILADRGQGHLAELIAEYSKDLRDKYAAGEAVQPPASVWMPVQPL